MVILEGIDPAYVKVQLDKLSNLNTPLSDVRDTISGGKSLADVYSALYSTTDGMSVYDQLKDISSKVATEATLSSILSQLDVALSTRASEATLQAIKAQTDKLTFDANGNLLVALSGTSTVNVGNFPSWFTSSTATTDSIYSKLDALDDALASVGTDKFRTSIVDPLPSGTNWIGKVQIGDGTNAASVVQGTLGGSTAYLIGTAPDIVKMFAGGTNYEDIEVSVSTTEASSTFSPQLKFALLTNTGDTDILTRINGPTAPQKRIPAHTYKFIMFPISSIYYVTESGSSTLRIEGAW